MWAVVVFVCLCLFGDGVTASCAIMGNVTICGADLCTTLDNLQVEINLLTTVFSSSVGPVIDVLPPLLEKLPAILDIINNTTPTTTVMNVTNVITNCPSNTSICGVPIPSGCVEIWAYLGTGASYIILDIRGGGAFSPPNATSVASYNAWCTWQQLEIYVGNGAPHYSAILVSVYDAELGTKLLQYGLTIQTANRHRVNYVINRGAYYRTALGYSVGSIQTAIWSLFELPFITDPTAPSVPSQVNAILADAFYNGSYYRPVLPTDKYVAFVLPTGVWPTCGTVTVDQPQLIELTLEHYPLPCAYTHYGALFSDELGVFTPRIELVESYPSGVSPGNTTNGNTVARNFTSMTGYGNFILGPFPQSNFTIMPGTYSVDGWTVGFNMTGGFTAMLANSLTNAVYLRGASVYGSGICPIKGTVTFTKATILNLLFYTETGAVNGLGRPVSTQHPSSPEIYSRLTFVLIE